MSFVYKLVITKAHTLLLPEIEVYKIIVLKKCKLSCDIFMSNLFILQCEGIFLHSGDVLCELIKHTVDILYRYDHSLEITVNFLPILTLVRFYGEHDGICSKLISK